jgi:uncharacterized membrane protein YfcA
MDPGPLRDSLTFLAGAATGVMSGLFGVGGAVISTPAIRALGCSAALAVGTTLPSIFPGSITGYIRYRPENLVDWPAIRLTVPFGFVAAIIGAELAHVLPGAGHPLMIITAVLLMWSSYRLIRGGDDLVQFEGGAGSRPRQAAIIGAVAGLLSGLLGIGGGVLLVPAFRQYLRLPMKAAVGTSLVCVGIFAVPGTITHALNGGIDWRFALWLTIGVVPGARLGSNIAMKASDRRLRLIFGVFLAVVSVVYAVGEISALVG